MFKVISLTNPAYLSQSPQRNPICWTFVSRDKETLTQLASTMRCKDYFNDVVALYKSGKTFSQYGYNNSLAPMGRSGFYVMLDKVNKEVFLHNLKVLNVQILADTGKRILFSTKFEQSDRVLIHIPKVLFESTYLISLATMLLRIGNYDVKFSSYEEFFAPHSPMNLVENSFTVRAQALALKHRFKTPKADYWLYYPGQTSPDGWQEASGDTIHNNGVSNWANALLCDTDGDD